MSVIYQSWEVASGPTVAYKVGPQGNNCANDGSTYRLHAQQDAVLCGLSALSLCVQPHGGETNITVRERGYNAESSRYSTESSSLGIGSGSPTPSDSEDLTSCPNANMVDQPLQAQFIRSELSPLAVQFESKVAHYNDHFWPTFHSYSLGVVSEDRPYEGGLVADEDEVDTLSSSSSMSEEFVDSSCSSGEPQAVGDAAEVQSSYCGPLDRICSPEVSLPPKKGLSRFYAGKSRSFSCLRDVTSVKDLAKPENPYARKRKNLSGFSGNVERPRLHPLRNGTTKISKKTVHNSKCTLALAVAMGAKDGLLEADEQDFQASAAGRWQSASAPCRSYSLSDLQRATGS